LLIYYNLHSYSGLCSRKGIDSIIKLIAMKIKIFAPSIELLEAHMGIRKRAIKENQAAQKRLEEKLDRLEVQMESIGNQQERLRRVEREDESRLFELIKKMNELK